MLKELEDTLDELKEVMPEGVFITLNDEDKDSPVSYGKIIDEEGSEVGNITINREKGNVKATLSNRGVIEKYIIREDSDSVEKETIDT